MSFGVQEKKTGDLIKAEDWNDAMEEIERLGESKLERIDAVVFGNLTVKSSPQQVSESETVSEEVVPWKLEIEDGDLLMSAVNASLRFKPDTGGAGIQYQNEQSTLNFYNGPASEERMTVTADGNIGIGTTSPIAPLEIRQKADANGDAGLVISEEGNSQKVYLHLANNSSGEYGYLDLGGTTQIRGNRQASNFDGPLIIDIGATDAALRITNNSYLLFGPNDYWSQYLRIGSNNPDGGRACIFTTDGNLHIDAKQGHGIYLNHYNKGPIYHHSSVVASDQNFKKDILPIEEPLEKIMSLEGKSYSMIEEEKKSIGFIAQEVEKVFPELVSKDFEGNRYMNYDGLIAPAIEAIKEQQKQIEQLRQEIKTLKSK